MRLIYIAGPYRSPLGLNGVTRNIEAARTVARQLWALGFAVLCPHLNTALMDGTDIPVSRWLEGDLEMLERCDILVVLEGWEQSRGTRGEIKRAKKRGIPAYFWPQDREALETIAAEPPAHSREQEDMTVRQAAAVLGAESHKRRNRENMEPIALGLFDECEVRFDFERIVREALAEWVGHPVATKEAA